MSVQTFDEAGYLENGHFSVQVKSTARPTELTGGRTITYTLDSRDLDHWLGEPWPVILVLYDSTADVAYWTHVQGFFLTRAGFSLSTAGRRVTIRIEMASVFDASAVATIRQLTLAAQQRLARRIDHG